MKIATDFFIPKCTLCMGGGRGRVSWYTLGAFLVDCPWCGTSYAYIEGLGNKLWYPADFHIEHKTKIEEILKGSSDDTYTGLEKLYGERT